MLRAPSWALWFSSRTISAYRGTTVEYFDSNAVATGTINWKSVMTLMRECYRNGKRNRRLCAQISGYGTLQDWSTCAVRLGIASYAVGYVSRFLAALNGYGMKWKWTSLYVGTVFICGTKGRTSYGIYLLKRLDVLLVTSYPGGFIEISESL